MKIKEKEMNRLIGRTFVVIDRYQRILRYLLNSCIVTVFDISVVWVLRYVFHLNLVMANTCGVIVGTMIGYYLTTKYVFESAKGKRGVAVYLTTFILGLILANTLIYIGDYILFTGLIEQWRFLLSKGISIVIPFFILYGVRKRLYTG